MYFVAILCPPPLNEKVQQLKYWMKERFGSVVALRSPAHITLIQPFWFEEEKERDLKRSLQEFTSDMDELEIQLDGFSHFGIKVLFAAVRKNNSLEELKKQAEVHFVNSYSGIVKKDDRPFHPHITIANRDLKPGDFEKAWSHFSERSFTDEFSSKTISLLRLTEGKWIVISEKQW